MSKPILVKHFSFIPEYTESEQVEFDALMEAYNNLGVKRNLKN